VKFFNILRCHVIKNRVVLIKSLSNEWCRNGFGDQKRYIATNRAKVTNMTEAEATCQINMFSEIKIAIRCNTKITYSV